MFAEYIFFLLYHFILFSWSVICAFGDVKDSFAFFYSGIQLDIRYKKIGMHLMVLVSIYSTANEYLN